LTVQVYGQEGLFSDGSQENQSSTDEKSLVTEQDIEEAEALVVLESQEVDGDAAAPVNNDESIMGLESDVAEVDVKKYYQDRPHPKGLKIGDIMDIFTDKRAPSLESLKKCDLQFVQFSTKEAVSKDARKLWASGFVKNDPYLTHWCFYTRLMLVVNSIFQESETWAYSDNLIQEFMYLAPIARAFLDWHGDIQYLFFSIRQYSILHEKIFREKVELTPEMTSFLVRYYGGKYKRPIKQNFLPDFTKKPKLQKTDIVSEFYKLLEEIRRDNPPKPNKETAEEYFVKGHEYFTQGKYTPAAKYFKMSRQYNPRQLRAWFFEIKSLMNLHSDMDVDETVKKFIVIHPQVYNVPYIKQTLANIGWSEKTLMDKGILKAEGDADQFD